MTPRPPVVGRLAPSPTGRLHVGHARSFLLAWWQVRSQEGEIRLRLEDLDRERSSPHWSDEILRDLEWLGLDWDGCPWWQSEGLEGLEAAVEALLEQGLVYPCVCTRRELAEAASAPHAAEHAPYPGTCRDRFESREEAARSTGRQAALRLRVAPGEIAFEDRLLGARAIDVARTAGDFPVTRRDGTVAYQLAVVVDDARQGVTEVLRGDDLVDSTPRQILVARALGLRSPNWTHVPLVVDDAGERLAKRTEGLALGELRQQGVDLGLLSAGSLVRPGCRRASWRRPTSCVPSFAWTVCPPGRCGSERESSRPSSSRASGVSLPYSRRPHDPEPPARPGPEHVERDVARGRRSRPSGRARARHLGPRTSLSARRLLRPRESVDRLPTEGAGPSRPATVHVSHPDVGLVGTGHSHRGRTALADSRST